MTFENKFMDIQAGMIALGMEYTQNQAEKIYIYGISERGLINFNIFFKINNSFVYINQVNTVLNKKVDISDEMVFSVLRFGNQDIQNMRALCQEYHREYPTEFWLVYDAKTNSLESRYSYEGRYDKDEELLPRLEFEQWFEQVKSGKDFLD